MKSKLIEVLLLLCVLLCAPLARGQVCSGYSSGQPSFTLLTPDQVAAQGGTTVTITAQAFDQAGNPLGDPSKQLIVTQATLVKFVWTTANATSAFGTYWEDQANQQTWQGGLSGSATWGPWPNADVGHKWNFQYTATGASGTTTDRIPYVSIVAGNTPGVIYEDSIHSNVYIEATSGFSGPSMANACTQCQLHPNECINKEHLPQQRWTSVVNNMSGETQPETAWNAGQKACETCAVSYTGTSPWISALPFDQIQFNVENQVVCDEFGIIFDNNDSLGSLVPLPEWAWFKGTVKQSTCKVATHDGAGGIQCDFINPAQSPTCTTRSWPSDFQPISAFFPANMVPGYPNTALVPPFVVTGSLGIRWPNIAGNRFVFPFYDLAGVVSTLPPGLAAITKLNSFGWPTTSSKIVDCTNYDAGIQPWFSPLIP